MSPEAIGPLAYGVRPARPQGAATLSRRPAQSDLTRALSEQEAKACAEVFGPEANGARTARPTPQAVLGRHIDVLA